ncbi:c-type cytochrome [Nitrospira moscoviensis]|uniref:Putative Cytochrome c n=1 Tax=Nitrospira moscoviensis TaxID=42253 RepID=A0A0K2GK33_NITMO|nr:cytochrome c [Nitrospira moscoviensis]ALA60962.1 Putative Cytochrome c [Nitrospira moscoviensis]
MRAVSACIVLLITTGTASIGPAGQPSAAGVEQGRRIYETRCLDCHGPQGRGDGVKAPFLSPRPGNLVSAATAAKSDKDLLNVIANGRPRTAMPAWKDQLSEEEQRLVLRYIRSLVRFHHPLTPPPPEP